MKKAAIVVAVVLTASMVDPVFAEPISDEQLGNIVANCSSINFRLSKTYKENDKNNEYNLNRYYEVIENNMKQLNLRLIKNNHADADIANQQTEFASERSQFLKNYKSYAQEMESLISTNCKEHPFDFYNKLESVRYKRGEVSASIARIEVILRAHSESVVKLRESYDAGN